MVLRIIDHQKSNVIQGTRSGQEEVKINMDSVGSTQPYVIVSVLRTFRHVHECRAVPVTTELWSRKCSWFCLAQASENDCLEPRVQNVVLLGEVRNRQYEHLEHSQIRA
jgi:hypothetical protein